MSAYFDQSDLKKLVAERTGETPEIVEHILETAFGAIAEKLGADTRVSFKDFGTIKLSERAERTYRLFGKEYVVPAHFSVKFKPSHNFLGWVNDFNDSELKVFDEAD